MANDPFGRYRMLESAAACCAIAAFAAAILAALFKIVGVVSYPWTVVAGLAAVLVLSLALSGYAATRLRKNVMDGE